MQVKFETDDSEGLVEIHRMKFKNDAAKIEFFSDDIGFEDPLGLIQFLEWVFNALDGGEQVKRKKKWTNKWRSYLCTFCFESNYTAKKIVYNTKKKELRVYSNDKYGTCYTGYNMRNQDALCVWKQFVCDLKQWHTERYTKGCLCCECEKKMCFHNHTTQCRQHKPFTYEADGTDYDSPPDNDEDNNIDS